MIRELSLFLFILKFGHVLPEQDCQSIKNCQQCIYAPSCGWYLEYSSVNGSGCFQSDYLEQRQEEIRNGFTLGHSHPPKASFYITKSPENAVVSPQEVSINVRLNEPFIFPITFTPRHRSWGTRTVEMKYRIQRENSVKLGFLSHCNGKYAQITETNKCDDLKFGDSVQFFVRVEAVKCAKQQPETIQKIQINPWPSPAIFRLNLYAYCYCPCELDDSVRLRANPYPPKLIPKCKNRGTFKCGVCYCREGYSGKDCGINTSNTIV